MTTMRTSGVRVDYDVPAKMRDGATLRANVYRPDDGGAGSYPALLTRLPYGKDLPLGSSVLDPAQVARRGYIVIVQDTRGTFTSEGEWFPAINEAEDGADTVAWAATLPGVSGVVGMYGASYFGYTQWAAASQHPTGLRAMAPLFTWSDAVNALDALGMRDGVLELGLQAHWALELGLDQAPRRLRASGVTDPQAFARTIYGLAREIDTLPTSGYFELPLDRFGPVARMGLDEPLNALVHLDTQPELLERSRIAPAYEMGLPTLNVGGWYDIFLKGTIQNFQRMRALGHSDQFLLIGPWTHGIVNRVQGDVDFGLASSGILLDMRTDLMSHQVQFFDRYLKGVQNGFDAQAPVMYFVMGANVWKRSATWPPAGVVEEAWYLHSSGHANGAHGAAGDGRLTRVAPTSAEPADHYQYDPANPTPTIGGATLLAPILRAGPRDQRPIEQRDDMLVYTSAPLSEPVEVAGPVRVRLYVASDAPDTDFVARLVDVYPDGRSIPVTDGIVRMRYREGASSAIVPLDPTTTYAIDIDLWDTSIVFLPGHRIQLDVTSSNFPRWARNLNTGQDSATSTEVRAARQTILHDEQRQAHLALSVQRG